MKFVINVGGSFCFVDDVSVSSPASGKDTIPFLHQEETMAMAMATTTTMVEWTYAFSLAGDMLFINSTFACTFTSLQVNFVVRIIDYYEQIINPYGNGNNIGKMWGSCRGENSVHDWIMKDSAIWSSILSFFSHKSIT